MKKIIALMLIATVIVSGCTQTQKEPIIDEEQGNGTGNTASDASITVDTLPAGLATLDNDQTELESIEELADTLNQDDLPDTGINENTFQ